MASNKERIENVEVSLGGLQDNVSRIELGMADKLRIIEENLKRLTDTIASNLEASNNNAYGRVGYGRSSCEEEAERIEGGHQPFCSKLAKLEFPSYSNNDLTEWFNCVEQFFEHQNITIDQKVVLASYHLEDEANKWWQWLCRVCKEEEKEITWALFEEELWLQFGPTKSEDFAIIKQKGSFHEYQKEFEQLGKSGRKGPWWERLLVDLNMK